MEFTPERKAEFEKIVARYPVKRAALLPVLRLAQEQEGWLHRDALGYVGGLLDLTLAQVHDTASFYTMFRLQPEGQTLIEVCTTLSCALGGADGLLERTCKKLGIEPHGTTQDGKFTVKPVECLAACGGAPAVQVNGEWLEQATDQDIDKVLAGEKLYRKFDWPKSPENQLYLFKNVWKKDSQKLETYKAAGGYANLKKYLQLKPEEIIDTVKKSNLRGRGGAGFPTGMKWSFLPKDNPKPRYLCVNADESEPGTYKDRVILENDPHQLVEATVVSTYAIGSKVAYIYIRGEFHEGYRSIQGAVDEAYAAGYVGKNILGTGVDVDVHVHRGAGSYECGEETALIESLEGKRGQPRLKPPFPAAVGVFGCPTIVNNVETLACVPLILEKGAEWFASMGTEKNGGPKLYSISGDVKRPGSYEIPMGKVTLRQLIHDYAGGPKDGRRVKAVVPGGSSTTVLTASRAGRADGLRQPGQGGIDAGLRRHHRDGRHPQHGVGRAQPHLLLQARVLRQVFALPRGHGLDAPAAAPARGRTGKPEGPRHPGQGLRLDRGQDAVPLRRRRGHALPRVDGQVPRRVRVLHPREGKLDAGGQDLRGSKSARAGRGALACPRPRRWSSGRSSSSTWARSSRSSA